MYTGIEDHQLIFGGEFAWNSSSFNIHLPLPIYEIIATSNIDLLGSLGLFQPQGFYIIKQDTSQSAMDYLGEFPRRIRFDHQGSIETRSFALYAADEWNPTPSTRLQFGLRGDHNSLSGEFVPSPRAALHQKINRKNELTLAAGLYTQNVLPFFQQDQNPNLLSEKSLHVNLEWTRALNNYIRVEWQSYGKYNFDMVSPRLVSNGDINLSSLLVPIPNSGHSQEEIDSLRVLLETYPDPADLPDSTRELAEYLFGDREFTYQNNGIGYVLGTELSCFYSPLRRWSGWVSADFSLSRRRDHAEEPFYDYNFHRPWSFNWVNNLYFPGQYTLSFKLRHSAGFAYTPYSGTLNSNDYEGNLILVGPRNSGRYAPYSRFDIRLFKSTDLWGHHVETYFEVWNCFNRPNYFLRDRTTGELKFPDLNLPFPFLFFGCIYHW